MPDTFFTRSPDWGWLIVLYFFLGGIAGGSYFLSSLLNIFGEPEDRPIVRLGYYIAFPAIALGGLLLALDLTQPLRFWHMLLQSHNFLPVFKYWSPMSVGSWGITLFGLCAFLSFVGSLAETDRIPSALCFLSNGPIATVIAIVGGLAGFFVASYTGVLLAVTNRPLWADTWFLGLLFLISGVSTSAALLSLLGRDSAPGTTIWLARFDDWVLLAELVVIALVVLTVGTSVFRHVFLTGWGIGLLFVVVVGILVPLALHWRPSLLGRLSIESAATLVLLGGLVLRMVIVLASEGA